MSEVPRDDSVPPVSARTPLLRIKRGNQQLAKAATDYCYQCSAAAEPSNEQHDAGARRQELYECVRQDTNVVYE